MNEDNKLFLVCESVFVTLTQTKLFHSFYFWSFDLKSILGFVAHSFPVSHSSIQSQAKNYDSQESQRLLVFVCVLRCIKP